MNVCDEIAKQKLIHHKMKTDKPKVIWLSQDAYAILCADLSVMAGRRVIPKIFLGLPIKHIIDDGIKVRVR